MAKIWTEIEDKILTRIMSGISSADVNPQELTNEFNNTLKAEDPDDYHPRSIGGLETRIDRLNLPNPSLSKEIVTIFARYRQEIYRTEEQRLKTDPDSWVVISKAEELTGVGRTWLQRLAKTKRVKRRLSEAGVFEYFVPDLQKFYDFTMPAKRTRREAVQTTSSPVKPATSSQHVLEVKVRETPETKKVFRSIRALLDVHELGALKTDEVLKAIDRLIPKE